MKYLKVHWVHSHVDYPSWLFSELDGELQEIRKVEIFPDGSTGFASPEDSAGGTQLSSEALPPIAEINSDPQFDAVIIDPAEFEQVWLNRKDRVRKPPSNDGHLQ